MPTVDRQRLREGRLARLQASMLARGVEACLLFNEPNIRYATGASTMPIWSIEPGIRERDLLAVSRTFLCGDVAATRAHTEAYRVSLTWLLGMREIVRPGITCGELARLAPRLPERYLLQRYECMVHGIGLEEESPSIAYPMDPQPNPDRELEEGMALAVEVCAGEVGGRDGVKLGDQVLLTADGTRNLAPYPYCDALSWRARRARGA